MRAMSRATKQLLSPLMLKACDRLKLSLSRDGEDFIAQLYTEFEHYDGTLRRSFPSMAAARHFTQRVPERKQLVGMMGDGTEQWQFAATDFTVSLIDHLWPREQIVFADDAARTVFDYTLLNCQAQERNAEIFARFKEHQAAEVRAEPWGVLGRLAMGYGPRLQLEQLELHPDKPLSFYQQVGLQNAMHSDGYALFMEQGTGKTPIVIARVCNEAPGVRQREGRMYRAIVVCPNNVRLNWVSEMNQFATRPGKITVLRGSQMERLKLFYDAIRAEDDCDYTVIVVSYETLCQDWDRYMQAVPWDLAVLDEGHYIKWPTTRRAKFAWKLRDNAEKRMILTGTPITNTALDVYSQLEFLGRGFSGFNSWKAFRSFYTVEHKGAGGHAFYTFQNLPFMQERLARMSFIVRKDEVLRQLPDKVYDIDEVEMTEQQRDVYKQIVNKLMVEVENDLADDSRPRSMVLNNVLTKLLRLAQVTSGFVVWDPQYTDDGELVTPRMVDRFDPDPKLERLVEILKEKDPMEKTIVWSCWVPNIRTIRARLELEGIDCVTYYGGTKEDERAEAERRFNCDPACRVLVANPAAGGTGLNLLGYDKTQPDAYETDVTQEVFYSQNWSMVARAQAEDRAHRRGTRRNVRMTDLVVPGTIDEEIRARVVSKRISAATIADVREILASVLGGVRDDK